jgi:hypothetical protein
MPPLLGNPYGGMDGYFTERSRTEALSNMAVASTATRRIPPVHYERGCGFGDGKLSCARNDECRFAVCLKYGGSEPPRESK